MFFVLIVKLGFELDLFRPLCFLYISIDLDAC